MANLSGTIRRANRVRRTLRRVGGGRPRLSVFRSSQHIYAQIIDDKDGHTLAAASTLDKDLRAKGKTGADMAAATAVGELIAATGKKGRRQGCSL